MSAPHTPGPWPITWGPVIDIAGIAYVPIASDGSHTANANLIASAPALLATLRAARTELWRLLDAKGISPIDINGWPEIMLADSAISRATEGGI